MINYEKVCNVYLYMYICNVYLCTAHLYMCSVVSENKNYSKKTPIL